MSDNEKKNSVYDLIININSILGFLKGWDITFPTGEEENNYEIIKNLRLKIFSVIGNKNRGKTFILSKIANRNLPNGYSETTKGLSISFPKDNNIALLDSVGFESPLIESDGEEYFLKSDNEKETQDIYKKLTRLKEEIRQLKQKTDIENIKDRRKNNNDIKIKENEFFETRNEFRKGIKKKDEQIYSLTNERRITDFFLQRFIIENANVLLLVVEKLSIDDQFFLNKLTKLIKQNHEQFLQKIIVIHNLKSMKHIETVKNYIENTLKKSLTFNLKEKADLKLKNRKNDEYNKCRFIEEEEDFSEKEIIHLIMAEEGSEAGNFYNESSIEFIRKIAKSITNTKIFDIIDKLKNYFFKISDTILKFEKGRNDTIKIGDIKDIFDEKTEKIQKIKLDYKNKLTLETIYGDLPDTFGEPKFNPLHHIVSADSKFLKIYLECPGDTKINDIDISYPNNLTKIVIKGKREKQPNKTMGRKFSSGEFEKKIILKGKDGDITNNIKVEGPSDGFYIIWFERDN